MRKKKKKSWEIFQNHHLIYPEEGEEKTVRITRTEHFFAGRIEMYAKAHGLTPGFVQSIRFYYRKYGANNLT